MEAKTEDITTNAHEWTRRKEQPQMNADKMQLLLSAQGDFAGFRASDSTNAYAFVAKEMKGIQESIANCF